MADVRAATPDGLGAHAVILLAVSEKPFQQASEYVRSRGTLVAIGLPPDAFLKAPVINTVVRMITIKGSYVGNQQDGVEALDFFARGLIKAPFKLAPLKDLPKIFELMGMLLFLISPSIGSVPPIGMVVLTDNRTRKDCRPLRPRDSRISAGLTNEITRIRLNLLSLMRHCCSGNCGGLYIAEITSFVLFLHRTCTYPMNCN